MVRPHDQVVIVACPLVSELQDAPLTSAKTHCTRCWEQVWIARQTMQAMMDLPRAVVRCTLCTLKEAGLDAIAPFP